MVKLSRSFFLRDEVALIARELLGKHIFTRLDGAEPTGGMIVETEAYAGPQDRASHAYANRRTKRTEVMFREGGVAYIYLCYGAHCLFNIITNVEGIPHSVFVRAIHPTCGIETMLRRRGKISLDRTLAGGPGVLTRALGMDLRHNGMSVTGNQIWLEDRGATLDDDKVLAVPRVGVGYAGADAARPWRFLMRDNAWGSRAG